MSPNHTDDDRVLREALASALEAMGQDVAEPIAALKRRDAKITRVIRWLSALTVSMAAALALVITLVIKEVQAADELDRIQDRTNNEVLCPLYELFLEASKFPPPPNYSEEQLKVREGWFVEIGEGHDKLGCEQR